MHYIWMAAKISIKKTFSKAPVLSEYRWSWSEGRINIKYTRYVGWLIGFSFSRLEVKHLAYIRVTGTVRGCNYGFIKLCFIREYTYIVYYKYSLPNLNEILINYVESNWALKPTFRIDDIIINMKDWILLLFELNRIHCLFFFSF